METCSQVARSGCSTKFHFLTATRSPIKLIQHDTFSHKLPGEPNWAFTCMPTGESEPASRDYCPSNKETEETRIFEGWYVALTTMGL